MYTMRQVYSTFGVEMVLMSTTDGSTWLYCALSIIVGSGLGSFVHTVPVGGDLVFVLVSLTRIFTG